jgi:fatty-acyl-CoA synthase
MSQSAVPLPAALTQAASGAGGYWFLSESGDERFTPYADLLDAARHVANTLRAAGLRRGEAVAVVSGDPEQFLRGFLGAAVAALVPVPVCPPEGPADAAGAADRLQRTLQVARARAVLCAPELAPALDSVARGVGTVRCVQGLDAACGGAAGDVATVGLDDVALIQFTSGSTSHPKGVVLTHGSLAANIEALASPGGLDLDERTVGASWLPLHHDMGLVGVALASMYVGCRTVLMPARLFPKRPTAWLKAITRHRATISFAPNFAYELCVRRTKDSELLDLDLSSWRIAGCGAEPISADTLAAFAERFAPAGFRPGCFVPSYGLAEHTVAVTFARRDGPPRVDVERRVVACGRPLPGHALRILDDDGRVLEDGSVGEIAVSGPSLMRGYLCEEGLEDEPVRDGWFRTGDLGYLDAGELFICGRKKDLILVAGRKYHPEDLEAAVAGLPRLRRGGVVAFAGGACRDGDRVVVVAEASRPDADLVREVRRCVYEASRLQVDDVRLVPAGTIPRTSSGKLRRADTRALYDAGAI